MFGALNRKLLAAAKAAAMPRPCPHCGHTFKPFADREFTSWKDFQQDCACPKCGRTVSLKELVAKEKGGDQANPPGPFARPIETRIERREVAVDQLLFYMPPTGRWGLWLFFALIWNLISWTILLSFAGRIGTKDFQLAPTLILAVFGAVGVGLAYVAIRHRFAAHLLYLSAEFVRMQRSLFRKTNHDLPTAEVRSVLKVEFYSQNYKPVHGIEIAAGERRIRFGSMLTDEEKNWLCWEIREFLRAHGSTIPPERVSLPDDEEDEDLEDDALEKESGPAEGEEKR